MLKPSVFYLGPDKAGSTWLYLFLESHPEVYVPVAKELFYFDKYYYKGINWYESFYSSASNERISCDISHDYLFSKKACKRICSYCPEAKLIINVREPISRAVSAYLYMRKQGRVKMGLEEAIDEIPELIEHGMYSLHIRQYLEYFDKDQIHLGSFDELGNEPVNYTSKLSDFLGIKKINLSEHIKRKALPSSLPRNEVIARFVHWAALAVRGLGFPGLINKVKKARLSNQLLYRTIREDEKPLLPESVRDKMMCIFKDDIEWLDQTFETDFTNLWGYNDKKM